MAWRHRLGIGETWLFGVIVAFGVGGVTMVRMINRRDGISGVAGGGAGSSINRLAASMWQW